jgi:hypothetical protein
MSEKHVKATDFGISLTDAGGQHHLIYLDEAVFGELAAYIAAQTPTGHWTTQPPTEPGWYWYKPEEDRIPEAVYLSIDGHGFARARVEGAYRRVSGSGATGLWYSEPLSVPGPNAK